MAYHQLKRRLLIRERERDNEEVVDLKGENDAPVSDAKERVLLIPEEIRLRLLRTVGEVLPELGKIDADYLPYQRPEAPRVG